MTYDDLHILIPCHSLEDFPTDLGEKPAEGLLNAFAVAFHPKLLAAANAIPRWTRADELLEVRPNRLVLIPQASESQVPASWIERARREGMNVVTGLSERRELIRAVLGPLGDETPLDPDLEADFLALGHLYLQTELLTRHMRQFGNVDESQMQREAVSAAKSALVGDVTAARTHLQYAFEMLLEARERFYPVNCFLMDLCLLIPRLAGGDFRKLLDSDVPISLLATAEDFAAIVREQGEVQRLIHDRWTAETLAVIGGDWRENCSHLLPLDSTVWNLNRGRQLVRDLFGRSPSTWGRRRFGVGPHMPQLLHRLGYQSALHFVMDDGVYPDEEYSKLQWQGADTTAIAAYSRIPLAGDSAAAFLRFPVRMAESMDHDHVAGLIFARWPEMRTPWLEDFHRAHRYAPVLGKFVTIDQFFLETENDGRMSEFREGTYLSPFLVQAVAKREAAPLSRYIESQSRRRRFEAAEWCGAIADLLSQGRVDGRTTEQLFETLELSGPDLPPADAPPIAPAVDEQLDAAVRESSQRLAGSLLAGGGSDKGVLVFNPLSFSRRVVVDWPADAAVPPAEAPVISRQFDERHRKVVLETPPCGYVWLPTGGSDAPLARPKAPLAEDLLLRNEFFEVAVSEATGGMAQIRTYGRGRNRLSQQLAWRFPREKSLSGDPEGPRTFYSEMRRRESRILSSGPALGAIETVGDLVEPWTGNVLATYRQTLQLWRGRPILEVDVELSLPKTPEGDPWSSYVASRFAWSDESQVLTRSLQETAQVVKDEQRIESSNFLELADDSARTTILTGGLAFHRKSGERMLDTILVTEGEQRRRFRFGIAIDQNFPFQAAMDFESPMLSVPVTSGPPRSGPAAWLFQVNARNVQIRRVLPLAHGDDASGCVVRLQETEGRNRQVKLGCFRPPVTARQLNFEGHRLHDFRVDAGNVLLSLAPYELCDVELRFA